MKLTHDEIDRMMEEFDRIDDRRRVRVSMKKSGRTLSEKRGGKR